MGRRGEDLKSQSKRSVQVNWRRGNWAAPNQAAALTLQRCGWTFGSARFCHAHNLIPSSRAWVFSCSLRAALISLGSGLLCPPPGHLCWSCSLLTPLAFYTHVDISLFSWSLSCPPLLQELWCHLHQPGTLPCFPPHTHLERPRFLCGPWSLLQPFGPAPTTWTAFPLIWVSTKTLTGSLLSPALLSVPWERQPTCSPTASALGSLLLLLRTTPPLNPVFCFKACGAKSRFCYTLEGNDICL